MDIVLLRLVVFHDRGLRPVAVPSVCFAVLPSVQARLVYPLVVLPSEDKGILLPHKALADAQPDVVAGSAKVVPLRVGMEDVEARARLQRLFGKSERRPQELAELRILHRVVLYRQTVRPLVGDVVRRVGQPQVRLRNANKPRNVGRACRVSTHEEVIPKAIDLARVRHRHFRRFRHVIRIGLPRPFDIPVAVEDVVDLVMAERQNAKVEPCVLQRLELALEQFHVPLGDLARLVVGDAERVLLFFREVFHHDGGNRLAPKLLHRLDPRVAVDDHVLAVDDDCAYEAELVDRIDDCRHRIVVVSRIVWVRLQVRDLGLNDFGFHVGFSLRRCFSPVKTSVVIKPAPSRALTSRWGGGGTVADFCRPGRSV